MPDNLQCLYDPYVHADEPTTWRFPVVRNWPPVALERSPESPGRYIFDDATTDKAICMKCKPAPCLEYLSSECALSLPEIPNDKPSKVCPTDAITMDENALPAINQDVCIGCQLCLIRCPIGVIHWSGNELKVSDGATSTVVERVGVRNQAETDTARWTDSLQKITEQRWNTTPNWVEGAIKNFQDKIKTKASTKEAFYPLARNLLRGLGLEAAIGRTGDTQWRFDCVVIRPFVMTVELKSPGENGGLITPESARQAIENAAIAQARYQLAPDPISLVIGYSLPNKRSDVRRVLSDVHASYGVSVGLYTAGTLLLLLLRHQIFRFHPEIDLDSLFRETFGACDEDVLYAFWADYFKRRLEIVALGETRVQATKLLGNIPYASVNDMAADRLIALWQSEAQLIEAIKPLLFP